MYISKTKKFVVSLLAIITIIFTAISASGLGLQHVSTTHTIFSNSITASFTSGAGGTGSYNTIKDKIVTGCYVRLIEGNYDSKRVKNSEEINSRKYASTSRANELGVTCYTYYGWFY